MLIKKKCRNIIKKIKFDLLKIDFHFIFIKRKHKINTMFNYSLIKLFKS